MAKPSLSGSPQTILVTSALLKYKGVDIGLVSGVKVSVKHLTTEVMTDQTGKSKVNHFHVGDDLSCEVQLDEYTAAKMKTAYPKAAFITSGGAARITWGRSIGEDFYSTAGLLEIIPTSDDTSYSGRHFKFWKAAPVGDSAFEYGPDKKIQIKTTFYAYPDFTKPNNEYFGQFGDDAAGSLVPAAAGSPTPGGGNVGDGTVTGVFVSDTFTKTETWTLSCIAAIANGGLFSVSGSVTGARGVATVGSAYTSNNITPANSEIGFLINDGATDFAVGDSFTIATTAANYT